MAAEAGADALGFIFVPGTPRYVGDRVDLEELLQDIPPFVTRVGVCRSLSDAARLRGLPLDAIQLYELPRPEERELLSIVLQGRQLIYAYRVRNEVGLHDIENHLMGFNVSGILLDAYHAQQLGGSGVSFDWQLACAVRERVKCPLILAGGLTPENVEAAVRQVQPWGVDVSSGVEAAVGKKDPVKVQKFIACARAVQACFQVE